REPHVLEHREVQVCAVDVVLAGGNGRHGPPGEDAADIATLENVSPHPRDREIRLVDARRLVRIDFHIERAYDPGTDLTAEAAAADDRDHAGTAQANPAAVENDRRIRTRDGVRPRLQPEIVDAAAFEKKVPFLREAEIEPRQIDLRFVDLDLREVRVVREVG